MNFAGQKTEKVFYMKRFKYISLLLAAFFLLAAAQAQDSADAQDFLFQHKQKIAGRHLDFLKRKSFEQSPERAFDVRYYRLRIRTDYPNKKIYGSVLIRFTSRSDMLNKITLDMFEWLAVDSLAGAAQSFVQKSLSIDLQLNRVYQKGESCSLEIWYHGNPQQTGATWFNFDKLQDGTPHIWTQSEPYGARYWWPCKDTPTDKPDSMDIYVTVPAEELVGSNGTLIAVQDNADGTKTFHWHEQYPIATYLVSLAITRYAHFQDYYHYSATDSMLLDYYVYPSYLDVAEELFKEMPDYLDALSFYFGPYPFLKEKYGMAQYHWGGAMEHQTLTSISRVSEGWKFVYVHELGHQWFGDAVTCASWQDIWLNEGFATYSEALYAEWAGYEGLPPGEASLHQYMVIKRYGEQKGQDRTVFVEDTTSVGNIFDRVVYYKGAWVLHMLRHVVGDETFFDILKSYVSDPRWKYASARTSNFKQVCEEKSGLDLSAFFDQWLNYPYFPRYEYSWVVKNSSREYSEIRVDITQTQEDPVYQMPIDLTFYFGQGKDTTLVVQNNLRFQSYDIKLPQKPVSLALDPKNWILRQVTQQPAEAYSAQVRFRNVFPNPFREYIIIHTVNWNPKKPEIYVYNILGQKVRRLLPFEITHYNYYYKWYGYNEQAFRMPPGIYFLRAPGGDKARKIVFLR